jgi:Fe-S cluster biogenesis protein NfuA
MDATNTNIQIRAEATPNPASMRFILDRPVLEDRSAEFTSTMQAESSPLAMRLFMLPMVTAVFLGPNFITVTAEDGDWATLREQVLSAIRAHFESGQPVMLGGGDGASTETTSASEVEAGIIRVIEEEIRPAVAMDGGDVVFVAFKDGIVHLRLRGACSGCPSAVFTLKLGIERRLRDEFPEIQAVEAV